MKQIIYCILILWLIVSVPFSTQTVLAQSSSLPGQPKNKLALHQSLTQQKPVKKAPADKAQSTPGVRHGHVLDLSSVVPDPAFGNYGSVRTFISGGAGGDEAYSVAIQSDGKIVAAGCSRISQYGAFALARYNTDGSLDNTFGTNGTARNYIPGGDNSQDDAFSVAIQSDGKIVAAGASASHVISDFAFALARYNADGTLDNTFGTNGTVRSVIGSGSDDEAYSVAIQSDGRIVAAGFSTGGSGNAFALARYNTDGTLDSTFGTNGTTRNYISGGDGTGDRASSVAIQSDGKIIAAGSSGVGDPVHYAFALARYKTDGSLDSTFGINGTTRVAISGGNGTDDEANSVAIQSDGKIVAAGVSTDVSGHYAFALARYKTDGSLDSAFGTNGTTRNFIVGGGDYNDHAFSVAIQGDGKIVAAGSSCNGSSYAFALARYTTNGSLDSTFGTNGTTRNYISGGNSTDDEAQSVAIQGDGKIVAAGHSADASGYDAFTLARYVVHSVDISVSGATSIGTTGATLNGTVNPFNVNTTVQFLYGTSPGVYADSVDATPGTVSTDADVPVSGAVTGLSQGQTYYYTISTTNSAGYYLGTEMSFTTSYATAGKALKFNGSTDYVSIPNYVLFPLIDQITIEAWIKPASVSQDERIVDNIGVGSFDGFLLDLIGGTPRLIIGSNGLSAASSLPVANVMYGIILPGLTMVVK